MSAASDHHGPATITDYIVHHLTNLRVGEGFWTLHLDTLFFSITLGGLFLWVTTPPQINTQEMLPVAVAKKVAYVPGAPFHPNGGGLNTMRMNFSNASEDCIREGMQRLSEVLKSALI